MTCPLRPSRGRPDRVRQKATTSGRISSGATPNRPRYRSGSSSCVVPAWLSVSMRTVSPERTVSTGGRSTGYQPQTTFSGVDRTTWSGSICPAWREAAAADASAAARIEAESERTCGCMASA